MKVIESVLLAGTFVVGLMTLSMGSSVVEAEDTSQQGGVEERGVPQFQGRPPVVAPTRPPTPSSQVMSAYRAALNQPAVRSAVDAEIRRQLRTVPPIAFVNGYWITPVDISLVYTQASVRASLVSSLRNMPGGLQALDTVMAGRTDVAMVFTPNQVADTIRIPRADVAGMMGLDAIRVRAVDSIAGPQPSGVNVFTVWGFFTDVWNWIAAWWQNHKNEQQQKQTRKNCQDKGPTGDCDGDGVSNENDACPYDPDCKHEKGSFVGCVIITCQTFTTEFSVEFENIIQQITTQIRQAGPAGQVIPLGQAAVGQASIGVVFPPGLR
jgi:hypothetical protein